jgi:exopolysaccharide production protein ExoZ
MYYSIHGCRAIAAMLVVCLHLASNLGKEKYFGVHAEQFYPLFCFGGTAGVAFFFVLSGFIITFIHRDDVGKPSRLLPYLRKRAARIYPSYLIVFAGVYVLASAIPSLRDAMPTELNVLVKALLLLPQDPAVVGGTGAPVITVAWSLQYELVFYASVALAIIHPLLFVLAVLLFVLNFVWQALSPAAVFPGSFFANSLMLLFGIGMATAWLVQSGWRMPRPLWVAAAAALLFFGVGAAEAVFGKEPYYARLNLGYGLCAAVAIVALVQAERERPGLFENRTVAVLGDASYAMYLIHFPLIAVLCKAAVGLGLHGVAGAVLAFVGIFVICVGASVLFYLCIERPMLRVLSARGPPGRARSRHATSV